MDSWPRTFGAYRYTQSDPFEYHVSIVEVLMHGYSGQRIRVIRNVDSGAGREAAGEDVWRCLCRSPISPTPKAATYLYHLRQRARNEQRGVTLIEMVVPAAVVGMASVALVGAIAITLVAGTKVEDSAQATSHAMAIIENTLARHPGTLLCTPHRCPIRCLRSQRDTKTPDPGWNRIWRSGSQSVAARSFQ